MPQPITHYLITRRALPKRYWGEYWWEKKDQFDFRPYFGAGSAAPDFFYLDFHKPNVWIKLKSVYEEVLQRKEHENLIKEKSSTELSNAIHGDKTFDMFCYMLDIAKQNKKDNLLKAKKQFCFALGFYSHVIADCVIHPYVYRNTKDHWATSDFSNELDHKEFEARLDKGSDACIRHNNNIKSKFKSEDYNWDCKKKNIFDTETTKIDKDIWDLFDQALKVNIKESLYPRSADYKLETDKINNSYKWFVRIAERTENADKFIEKMDVLLAGDRNNFFNEKISDVNLPDCTPKELFELAVKECNKVFEVGFSYFLTESNEFSAKKYFNKLKKSEKEFSRYLSYENWNLDTGLPSKYNNEKGMLEESEKHYFVHLDILEKFYKE